LVVVVCCNLRQPDVLSGKWQLLYTTASVRGWMRRDNGVAARGRAVLESGALDRGRGVRGRGLVRGRATYGAGIPVSADGSPDYLLLPWAQRRRGRAYPCAIFLWRLAGPVQCVQTMSSVMVTSLSRASISRAHAGGLPVPCHPGPAASAKSLCCRLFILPPYAALSSEQEPWLNTADPFAREILIGVMSVLAKYQSDQRSKNTKAGIERARAAGVKIGGR
jgi:hypothetical protein